MHQGWHEAGGLLGSRRGEGFLSCGFLNIIPAARSILVFLPLAACFSPQNHTKICGEQDLQNPRLAAQHKHERGAVA